MSIFGKILSKLGFGEGKKDAAPVKTVAQAPQYTVPTTPLGPPSPGRPKVVTISEVDVVAKLTELAKANPQKLNWKLSIVDLLKLLDIDSSFAARKELAIELGCPAEKMRDSAQMNMWLHKAVLRKLAENGGNIPADLLD